MKILWIEDQESENKNLFGGEFYKKNVIRANSFKSAIEELKEIEIKYDFVIFDLNLEKWSDFKNLKKYIPHQEELSKEQAGYDLYLSIAFSGFPKDRILFLTHNTESSEYTQNFGIDNLDGIDNFIAQHDLELSIEQEQELIELENQRNIEDIKTWFMNNFEIKNIEENNKQQENTYDELVKLCENARIELPTCINKNNKEEFDKWLEENTVISENAGNYISKEEKQYITLRRGIIEGCNYICNKLPEYVHLLNEELSKLNTELRNARGQESKENLKEKIKKKTNEIKHAENNDYKRILKQAKKFFSLKMQDSNLKDDYYDFLSNISSPWDSYRGEENHNKIVKLVRNWTAHNLLSREDDLNVKFIGFLFIVLCRAIIEEESFFDDCEHEKILLSLFKTPDTSIETLENYICSKYYKLFSDLHKSSDWNDNPLAGNLTYINLIDKYGKIDSYRSPRNKDDIQKKSIKFLYHSLLDSYCSQVSPTHQKKDSEINITLKFKYIYEDLSPSKNIIAKTIYNELLNLGN